MREHIASLHDNSAIARVAAHRRRSQCVVMRTAMLLPGCDTPQWEGKMRLTQADRFMARSVLTTRDVVVHVGGKGKAISVQFWNGPEGSSKLRLPGFPDSRHLKTARLPALRTGHLYHQGILLVLVSVRG